MNQVSPRRVAFLVIALLVLAAASIAVVANGDDDDSGILAAGQQPAGDASSPPPAPEVTTTTTTTVAGAGSTEPSPPASSPPRRDAPVVRPPTTADSGNASSPISSPALPPPAGGPPTTAGGPACPAAGVRVTVTSDKPSYAPGETVRGATTIENRSSGACLLPTRGFVRIMNAAGKDVSGFAYTMEYRFPVLAEPGKTFTTPFTWNQKDCSGGSCVQVPAGAYTVVADWTEGGPYSGRGSFTIGG